MIDYCRDCKASKNVKEVICKRCMHDTIPAWKPFNIQKINMDNHVIDTMIDSDITWDSITAIMNDVIIHNIPLSIAIVNEIKRIHFSEDTEGLQDLKRVAFALTGDKIQECDTCTNLNHFFFASCNSCEIQYKNL